MSTARSGPSVTQSLTNSIASRNVLLPRPLGPTSTWNGSRSSHGLRMIPLKFRILIPTITGSFLRNTRQSGPPNCGGTGGFFRSSVPLRAARAMPRNHASWLRLGGFFHDSRDFFWTSKFISCSVSMRRRLKVVPASFLFLVFDCSASFPLSTRVRSEVLRSKRNPSMRVTPLFAGPQSA